MIIDLAPVYLICMKTSQPHGPPSPSVWPVVSRHCIRIVCRDSLIAVKTVHRQLGMSDTHFLILALGEHWPSSAKLWFLMETWTDGSYYWPKHILNWEREKQDRFVKFNSLLYSEIFSGHLLCTQHSNSREKLFQRAYSGDMWAKRHLECRVYVPGHRWAPVTVKAIGW